jgi:hypothetical protein
MATTVFYSLKTTGDVDFWGQAGDSARRTLIMPLSNPREFIAFGVLAPSNEVPFVARGEVLAHMGPFLGRMAQAGASAELYARVPLPGSIVNRYIKDDPHDQKEADRPPPAPNLTGNVTVAGEEPSTFAYEGNEGSLWTISGSTRRVLSTHVPGSNTAFLAFGLVYVDEVDYLWRVNFVAHIEDSSALSDFLAEMPSGTTLQSTPPTALPEEWDDYMEDPFASSLAAAMAVAQVGQAKSGAKRVSTS